MRRKTVELDTDLAHHSRVVQKKVSCQIKHKTVVRHNPQYQYQVRSQFACSEAIAMLFVEDLMDILEGRCRQADERKYEEMISSTIDQLEHSISSSYQPISGEYLQNQRSPNAEEELLCVPNDWICGGKQIQCQKRRSYTKNASIIDSEHKPALVSKRTLNSVRSSINLLRLPKEQQLSGLSLKRQLQALKLPGSESDRYEDMIRERLFRNTAQKNMMFKSPMRLEAMDKTNSSYRQNFLATSNDQFSYDYDGSAIPIRTLPKKTINKVNVLNTTYRFAKENIVNKKGSASKILPVTFLKTEIQECDSKSGRQNLKNLILARKQSALESSNNLKYLPTKDQEQVYLKNKFDQLMKNRTIRIRQIKQN